MVFIDLENITFFSSDVYNEFDTNISSQYHHLTKGLDFVFCQLRRMSEQRGSGGEGVCVWYDLILKNISLLDENPEQLIHKCPATPVLIDD